MGPSTTGLFLILTIHEVVFSGQFRNLLKITQQFNTQNVGWLVLHLFVFVTVYRELGDLGRRGLQTQLRLCGCLATHKS